MTRPLARATALALWFALLGPTGVSAQTPAALGDGPLSLDAADGVEWRREEHLFIAEGKATARQGDVSLAADRLVAAYRSGAGDKLEIFRIDAEGDVRIENGGDVATGARAAFDLDGRAIVLSGPGLRYATEGAVVTAKDTLEYLMAERRAVARGDATVTDDRGSLSADVIEARLKAGDARGVDVARAWGGVAIRTAQETVRADRAEYDFNTRKARAVGNVRISRGGDVLTGARADVDLGTGISRLEGGATQADDGRVRGLVFPKAKP